MPYLLLSVEAFGFHLQGGRYRSARQARQAVAATHWLKADKIAALSMVDTHFAEGGIAQADVVTAVVPDVAELTFAQANRTYAALSAAARVAPRFQEVIIAGVEDMRRTIEAMTPEVQALAAPPGPKGTLRKARLAAPMLSPVPELPAEAPPKSDFDALFSGPVKGEDEEDGEDGPTAGPTPQLDIDVRIAELEAKETSEKERTTLRMMGELLKKQAEEAKTPLPKKKKN